MEVKISDLRSMPFDQVEKHYAAMQSKCKQADEQKETDEKEKSELMHQKNVLAQQNNVLTTVHDLGTRIVVAVNQSTTILPSRRERIVCAIVEMTFALKKSISAAYSSVKDGVKAACEGMYDAAVKICNFVYDHSIEVLCGSVAVAGTITMVMIAAAHIILLPVALLTGNFSVLAANPFDSISIPS